MDRKLLELIVQKDYADFALKEVFESDDFFVYKVKKDKPCEQSYLVATPNDLTRVFVSDKEYQDVEVVAVYRDKITIQKENPFEDSILKKDIALPEWLKYNNQRFIFTKDDQSEWSIPDYVSDRLIEKVSHIKYLPEARLNEKYCYSLNISKNFAQLISMKETSKSFPEDIFSDFLEKESLWYFPKRDKAIFENYTLEEQKAIQKILEERIPTF